MARNAATFLARNRFGIYYFQRRTTKADKAQLPTLPTFVRLSLRTTSKSEAIKLARKVAVMWDSLAQKTFNTEADFHHALDLLSRYLRISSSTNTSLEFAQREFFDHLDDETDNESLLLERAIEYHRQKQLSNGISLNNVQLNNALQLLNLKKSSIPSKKISEAIDEYITVRQTNWKKHSSQGKAFKNQYKPFIISILGDVNTNEITKSMVSEVGKIIVNYPKNKNKIKKYKNTPIREFLNKDIPEKDRIAARTVIKYRTQIGGFLKWLQRNDLTEIDLDAPLSEIGVKKSAPSLDRSAYTCEDLRKLYNSKEYVRGTHKKPSHFWVPLIALISGARLNEICQLALVDIQFNEESDRWVFDFNEDEGNTHGKSIKGSRKRLVPIHKTLINLGFLDYFEQIKKLKDNDKRLFPDLKYIRDEGKYGTALGRWFDRTYTNKRNCNITTLRTSFHSLRHTFSHHMVVKNKIHSNSYIGGIGQTPEGNQTEVRYSKQDLYMNYKEYFDMVNFGDCIDFKIIKHWKHYKLI